MSGAARDRAADPVALEDAAMREAMRLARRCEGRCGLDPNGGAVLLLPEGGTLRCASRPGDEAWARVLRRAGDRARGARLVLSTAGDPRALRAAARTHALAGVVIADEAARGRTRGWRPANAPHWAAVASEVHRQWWVQRRTGRPFVTLKAAVSLDGALATGRGHSQWITGPAARRESHRLRARHAGVAVGVGTALADDPRLDVRLVRGSDPVPVVFDRTLRLLAEGPRLALHRAGVVVLHGHGAAAARRRRADALGMRTLPVRTRSGRLDLPEALVALREQHALGSLMVEGGGRLLASFVAAGLYDELWLFQAPRLLGGGGQPLLPGLDFATVDAAPRLQLRSRRALGEDMLWVCAAPDSPPGG